MRDGAIGNAARAATGAGATVAAIAAAGSGKTAIRGKTGAGSRPGLCSRISAAVSDKPTTRLNAWQCHSRLSTNDAGVWEDAVKKLFDATSKFRKLKLALGTSTAPFVTVRSLIPETVDKGVFVPRSPPLSAMSCDTTGTLDDNINCACATINRARSAMGGNAAGKLIGAQGQGNAATAAAAATAQRWFPCAAIR